MKIDHDGHIHTYLSSCSHDENQVPVNILKKYSTLGIKTVCFTDHLWQKGMPGTTDSYHTDQNEDHIAQIKDMIPVNTFGIKVLIGCETNYLGDGYIGINKELASTYDFVLAPTNHAIVDYYKDKGIHSSRDIAKNLIQRFKEVISFEVANGIAHPFLPLGYFERGDEILNLLSKDELNECFSLANEYGVSIELNTDTFASNWDRHTKNFTDESYMRIYEIAKKAKCKFHFASDAHSLQDMDLLFKMQRFVDQLQINEDDINPIFQTRNIV